MSRNTVILVDESDNFIGISKKLDAHLTGALHSAFSVFVFRRQGGRLELLLQKRSKRKYHCGGLWSNSCCSHPELGEELSDSARSRLREEMGFSVPLRWVGSHTYRAEVGNNLIEHEFDHIFVGWHGGEDVVLNPEEAEAFRWIETEELKGRMRQSPEKYTPWFAGTLEKAMATPDLQEIST